jgi:hypothetical protein
LRTFTEENKMVQLKKLITLCSVAALCGCAAVQPISPEMPSITLDESYTRGFDNAIGSATLPAGVYRPSFRTQRGVYYEAPSSLILGRRAASRGGLFIPNSPDDKQACWLGEGILVPTHRYTFHERIPYR